MMMMMMMMMYPKAIKAFRDPPGVKEFQEKSFGVMKIVENQRGSALREPSSDAKKTRK